MAKRRRAADLVTPRARAERLVAFWAARMFNHIHGQPDQRPSVHPLARLDWVISTVKGPAGRITAHGIETQQFRAPAAPLIDHYALPDDEADRIMRAISGGTHGVEIRKTLYLWGLGVPLTHQADARQIARKTLEKRLECGLYAIEILIGGRWLKDAIA